MGLTLQDTRINLKTFPDIEREFGFLLARAKRLDISPMCCGWFARKHWLEFKWHFDPEAQAHNNDNTTLEGIPVEMSVRIFDNIINDFLFELEGDTNCALLGSLLGFVSVNKQLC
jgi:hypothetical protein